MNDQPKLEGALALVLSSGELKELISEYAEIGIDSFMKEGLARDIPVINTFVAAIRVGAAVRDRIFMQKLLAFLGPLADLPAADRAAMVEKLENDPAYGRKVGEHLIELIDRIEAHKKPRMLARVLRAYSAGEIDATTLHRLAHAIQQVPAFDIPYLRVYRNANASVLPYLSLNEASMHSLTAGGLVKVLQKPDKITYLLTAVGLEFMRLELDRQE